MINHVAPRPVRIAIVQPAYCGWNPKGNIEASEKLIESFSPETVDVICFPELYPGKPGNLSDKAKILKCHIIYGFAAKTNTEEAQYINEAAIIGPSGQEIGRHRKILLSESEKRFGYVSGSVFEVYEARWGKFGIAICNDLALASTGTEQMVIQGAEIIFVPSMAIFGMHDYWTHQLISRSLDYGVPIVFVNIAGSYEADGFFFGRGKSKIVVPLPPSKKALSLEDFFKLKDVSPSDHVVFEMNSSESVAVVEIDLARFEKYRSQMKTYFSS